MFLLPGGHAVEMAPPPIPDEEWEVIWAPLKEAGWRHEGVPGGVNYFFPPGIVKVSDRQTDRQAGR